MGNIPQGAGPYQPPAPGPSPLLSAPSLVTSEVWKQLPPSALYITRDDKLRFMVTGEFAANRIRVSGKMLSLDGCVIPFTNNFEPLPAGVPAKLYIDLAEGWLLSVAVDCNNGVPQPGFYFAQVALVRGGPNDEYPTQILTQGTFSTVWGMSWPSPSIRQVTDAPGPITEVNFAAPAAGAEFNFAQPNTATFLFMGATITLTTDATAGNRQVAFIVKNGAVVEAMFPANAVQPPSTTWTYCLTGGAAVPAAGTFAIIPISPNFAVGPNIVIATKTTGMGAADQYSALNSYIQDLTL